MNKQTQQTNAEMTPCFRRAYAALPEAIRRIADRKMALLAQNPAHPSLAVHRVKRCEGRWECAISSRYRQRARA